jgi:polysaccharide export outer membrane protein
MPLSSRGQLLAGIGALLGLWAGPGCQSKPIRPDAFAQAKASPVTPPGAWNPRIEAGPIQPVAAATPESGPVVASAWHEAQRISPDLPAPEGAPASSFVARPPGLLAVEARAAMEGAPGEQPAPIASAGVPPPPPLPLGDPHQPPGPPGPLSHMAEYHGLHPAPVPKEFQKQSLPPYVVEPPDILLIRALPSVTDPVRQPLDGQHLVRPDGSLSLGVYGDIYVAGLKLEEIKDVVARAILARIQGAQKPDEKPDPKITVDSIKLGLQVDVVAYNSKVYYIITDGGGYGEQVFRIPATGNETVLDALGQIYGLPAVASKKKIWVARATPDGSPHPLILPVDWRGITQLGSAATNYQLYPGDRIYVQSNALIRLDSRLAQFLAPIERVLGATLLGSSVVNSIKNGGRSGSTTP